MQLPIFSSTGVQKTTQEVSDVLFGQKPNLNLLAQAVFVFQGNARQASSLTKRRGDINRTHKKWFKQKGTGNARHGARTPSIFVGGGVAHGPDNQRNYVRTLSKTLRRKALCYALSAQVKEALVCDNVLDLKGKTQEAIALMRVIAPEKRHVLIVVDDASENVLRATNNLAGVMVTQVQRINAYEVLMADALVFTKSALVSLEKRVLSTAEDVAVKVEEKAAKITEPKKKTVVAKKPSVKAIKTTPKKLVIAKKPTAKVVKKTK